MRYLFRLRSLNLLLTASMLIGACSKSSVLTQPQFSSYNDEIIHFQEELNAMYKDPERSPLKEADRDGFEHLDFFPANEMYRVIATLVLTPDEKPFQMKTSTDRLPIYRQYGIASFVLEGKTHSLRIYENVALAKKPGYKDYLFLPYNDETNGVESYGGGRYIDLKKGKGDTILLDFNKSYNPYCAYNDRYSCPIPPVENQLSVEIRAGVKAYSKADH